jgi:hypothetical protein
MKLCNLLTVLASVAGAAALTASGAATGGMVPVHTIELHSSRDIADATAVETALSAVLQRASSCPLSNMQSRMACVCRFKAELGSLRSSYSNAVVRHPAWNAPNTAVGFVDARTGLSNATVYPNIKRQLDLCPGR